MIAPAALPPEYVAWNRKWHAPHGRPVPAWLGRLPLGSAWIDRLRGPFAFQPNSSTRRFEYPWAFHAVPVRKGMNVVDLGGGLSGFQFALASSGARVINVDPFVGYGSPDGYRQTDPAAQLSRLGRLFRATVEFRRSTLADAGLGARSVDVVYCISTLEHLDTTAVASIQEELPRVLVAGGCCVLTVDLFLDLAPFTTRSTNQWGANLDVGSFVERSALEMVAGNPLELYGCPGFDADRVQSQLSRYLLGEYPGMAQCLVLRKG